MQNRILVQSLLICLIAITIAVQNPQKENAYNQISSKEFEAMSRTKRAAAKPGFFGTLFSVIYEQWNDTRNTFGTVNNLINDNFLPEDEPVTESTTAISNPNISTTAAPYRITRTEFNKIISRNLRGLQRLFQIELQEALQQSDTNYAEYKKNASKEISRFL